MGKFSKRIRIKNYTFGSLDGMVCDIVDEYKDKEDIEIYVSCDEVADLAVALFSTGLFRPVSIEFASPEIDGYCREYLIAIHRDGDLFIGKTWDEDKEIYLNSDPDYTDAVFASQKIDINLLEHLMDEGYSNIIYYEF